MPGFSAGQYSTGERGLSDIESVQAPVVDNSSVVKAQAQLQGINAIVDDVSNVRETYKNNARIEATAKAKEEEKSFSNQYDSTIRQYSGLVATGQMTQEQATVYINKAKDSLVNQGASADDLTSTELQTTKTLAGRAYLEGSEEEQAEKAFNEKYSKSPYWTPGQTPIQESIGKANMLRDQQEAQARATNMSKLQLEAAQFEKGSNEYKLKQREIKEEQMNAINNALLKAPVNHSNEQKRLVAEYEANILKVGEAEAKVLLENKWEAYVRTSILTADQFAAKVEGGLPVQRTAYVDNLTAASEAFLESIGDGQVVSMGEDLLKISQGKLKIAMINSSEPLQKMLVAQDIFGPQAAAYTHDLTAAAATELNDFNVDAMTRKEGDPAPTFGKGEQAISDARETLSLNIKDFLDGKHKGDPKNLEKLFSGHVARVSEDFKTMTTKEIDKSIAFLATPEVGRFVKMRGLTNADLDNVKRQVFTYKGNVADTFVKLTQDTLLNAERREEMPKTSPRMIRAAQSLPSRSDFDLVFEGNQVMVKAKTERGRKSAEEVNNKVTGPLTRIVRVDSNLSGASQESIFNAWKEQLWPDETQQEQAAPTPEVAPKADPSEYSGKVVEDANGDRWASRGGTWVKVGSRDDGSK